MGFLVLTGMAFGKRDGKLVSKVRYDSNLLNLQARGVPSVELQHHMFEESDGSLLYASRSLAAPRRSASCARSSSPANSGASRGTGLAPAAIPEKKRRSIWFSYRRFWEISRTSLPTAAPSIPSRRAARSNGCTR